MSEQFTAGPTMEWRFIPNYGTLRTLDGVPQAIQVSETEEVLWENVPEDVKAAVLAYEPPSRGTMTVTSVDEATNTIYLTNGREEGIPDAEEKR